MLDEKVLRDREQQLFTFESSLSSAEFGTKYMLYIYAS